MKIDRKKIVNRCGYDQRECLQLAKHLSECPDEHLISELKKITVWNYGKCELGLWADVLDRLDSILEKAVTKVGKWKLYLDCAENSDIIDKNSNVCSKRSNYFVRLDPSNSKLVLERLTSIAETWGGVDNGFGLAACCDSNYFPESAGNIYYEYQPYENSLSKNHTLGSTPTNSRRLVLHAVHCRNQSPSEIMEEILTQHPIPPSKRMALFTRLRLAAYFIDPEQRQKCIRARLQALSILCYAFEVDERLLYPSIFDELVAVLELPDGQYTGIKACAMRTMTAIIHSYRLNVNWSTILATTGLCNYHGILPSLTRRCIQGLIENSIDAPSGSANQHFLTALLSFMYYIACCEENNVAVSAMQNVTLSSSGVLDTMLQLIAWHTPRNDYLNYATRAVRVTDQILTNSTSSHQHIVGILVDRLKFEVNLVLASNTATADKSGLSIAMNAQRSGLMKSILNLLKRLCMSTEWGGVMHDAMDGNLPNILREIFLSGTTHFTPHLALFAMETITNYLYTYPSRLSVMQDKQITGDILKALTSQPLPQNQDFLVQLPGLFNTLALNSRGIGALQSSDVLMRYLDTLVSPNYLVTMKMKRVRDNPTQISYNLSSTGAMGHNTSSNTLTAIQMSDAVQELLRSHNELKPCIFKGLVACLKRVLKIGSTRLAVLVPDSPPASDLKDPSKVTITPVATAMDVESSEDRADITILSAGESDTSPDTSIGVATVTPEAGGQTQTASNTPATPGCSATPLTNETELPPYAHLSDFIFNTCKFLEKLLPSVLHITEAMCRQFVSHDGLTALCDLLRMPGLPYDFPVSAACASLCKIFEELSNATPVNDVVEPLLNILSESLKKLMPLRSSPGGIKSILLRNFLDNDNSMLHELVVVASVICILVQIIDHLKPELRTSLASKWVEHAIMEGLGTLYIGVSWETGILLKVLFGDKNITCQDMDCEPLPTAQQPQINHSDQWKPVTGAEPMPQFVEALHLYAPLKASRVKEGDNRTALLHQRPDLAYAVHRIVHVNAFLINSMTELCTAWTRFFSNRNPTYYRRRRVNSLPGDQNNQIPVSTKYSALSQISVFLLKTLTWREPELAQDHPATACLAYSMRYAYSRLSGLLLTLPPPSTSSTGVTTMPTSDAAKASQLNSQLGMVNSFYMHNCIPNYFAVFEELIKYDTKDPSITEAMKSAIEEFLVCADRITTAGKIAPEVRLNASSDAEGSLFNVNNYIKTVNQDILFPLEQLCTRSDLQRLLTRRAVEHLLNVLVTVIPYLFRRVTTLDEADEDEDEFTDSQITVSSAITPTILVTQTTESSTTDVPPLQNTQTPSPPGDVNPPAPGSTTVMSGERSQEIQPMDTSDVEVEGDVSVGTQGDDNNGAIRLIEEMGFPRRLAVVALEHTRWDTCEAVNLLIATPPEDLIASTSGNTPAATTRAPRRLACLRELWRSANVTGDSSTSSSGRPLVTVGRSSPPRLDPQTLPSADKHPSVGLTIPDKSAHKRKPVDMGKIIRLRDSLRRNVFRACYAIAKYHSSDQILRKITDLLLSSSAEKHNINDLFGVVVNGLSEELKDYSSDVRSEGIAATGSTATSYSPDLFGEASTAVCLHLVALLFTRCRFLCAQLAAANGLPGLLIAWIARHADQDADRSRMSQSMVQSELGSDPLDSLMHQQDTEKQLTCASEETGESSNSQRNQIVMLAALIVDQYERSVQAMHLRYISTTLYTKAHNWHWFDNRAMIWHPYTAESNRTIDTAFCNGSLTAACQINRRPYTIEFPTMIQANMTSLHRRPVLLFPAISSDTTTSVEEDKADDLNHQALSAYERYVLSTSIPASLSKEQRFTLCSAILQYFQPSITNGNKVFRPLASGCINALLRLLLRLAYSSYTDAEWLAEANFLKVLFNYPHPKDFTSEFAAFVVVLLTQVFDDAETVSRSMRAVLNIMANFGVPSTYLDISARTHGCRDLFYILSMCCPLLAKDRQLAIKLATDVFNLTLTETDIEAKCLPKTHLLEPREQASPDGKEVQVILTDRQKSLVNYLIDVVLHIPAVSEMKDPSVAAGTEKKLTKYQMIFGSTSTEESPYSTLLSTPSNSHQLPLAPRVNLPTSTDTDSSSPSGNMDINAPSNPISIPTPSPLTLLGKVEAIRFLIDLASTQHAVAEYIALYNQDPSSASSNTSYVTNTEQEMKKVTNIPSFLAHLFQYQLCIKETSNVTMDLLENLVLLCSPTTQSVIIAGLKASLRRIVVPTTGDAPLLGGTKNDRLIALMLFFERMLNLPQPLANNIISLIYGRRIPADIAKLAAQVDCNTETTQKAINTILLTLENLTLPERQPNKQQSSTAASRSHADPSTNTTTSTVTTSGLATTVISAVNSTRPLGVAGDSIIADTNLTTTGVTIATTTALTGGNSGVGATETPPSSAPQRPGRRTAHFSEEASEHDAGRRIARATAGAGFDTDSYDGDEDEDDDDDDDDDDDTEQRGHTVSAMPGRSNDLILSDSTHTRPTTLNMLFDNVLVAQRSLVLDDHHRLHTRRRRREHDDDISEDLHEDAEEEEEEVDDADLNIRSGWRAMTSGEDNGSIIFVHNAEEDGGSAGQGGEADNSQDEDEDETAGGMDDDEADDDEDDEEDEEEGESDALAEDVHDDVEHDENDDTNDEHHQDDMGSGFDEVELVLSRRSRLGGVSANAARRLRREPTISVTVSTGGTDGDATPVNLSQSSVDDEDEDDVHHAELMRNDDSHGGDDGSYDDDDDVDTFDRDDDDDELNGAISAIFPGSGSRLLRGSNSIVTNFQEMLMGASDSRSGGGLRRERFTIHPTLNSDFRPGILARSQLPEPPQNLGLLLPRTTSIPRGGYAAGTTAVFRFGSGGGGTSFLVTGGGSGIGPTPRFTRSSGSHGINLVTTGTGFGVNDQNPPTSLLQGLPSQHPLLQPPTQLSTFNATTSTGATSTSNVRLNRALATNAMGNNRVLSVFPPQLPVGYYSLQHNHHHRNRGSTMVNVTPSSAIFGSSGPRHRGPPTRFHGAVVGDTINFPIFPPPDNSSSSLGRDSLSLSSADNSLPNPARDVRCGHDADTQVWSLLASLAEDQPTFINAALASAVFSPLLTSGGSTLQTVPAHPSTSGAESLTSNTNLTPYAGLALPPSYRRWIGLSRMLFGSELMNLLLISRHEVYEQLFNRRAALLAKRIDQVARVAASDVPGDSAAAPVPAISDGLQATAEAMTEEVEGEDEGGPTPMDTSLSHTLPTDLTVSSSIAQAETGEHPAGEASAPVATQSQQEETQEPETSTASDIPPTTTTPSTAETARSSATPQPVSVPMTDEETIQSLVEGGMDPSFLDALPDEIRREVIADHRRTLQLQSQQNRVQLPEYTSIQDEVLEHFRTEQQQARTIEAPTDTTSTPSQAIAAPTPESNTTFLLSLPTSLRREVLTDMDESQLDALPSELAAEARQLRCDSDAYFARALHEGRMSQSWNHRNENNMWQNISSSSGLIGGNNRWDIRFNSINQFLHHLRSNIEATGTNVLDSVDFLQTYQVPHFRGRRLIDQEGLTCLITLLVTSSPSAPVRRNIIPSMKRLLRNICSHPSSRTWLVNTLLCLLYGLSENSVAPTCDTVVCDADVSGGSDETFSTIFDAGFEVALGCWVRIFHPKTLEESSTSLSDQAPTTQRYNIHPQVAVSVAGVLLDILYELALNFPVHFSPPRLSLVSNSGDAGGGDEGSDAIRQGRRQGPSARRSGHHVPGSSDDTNFWEIFERLARSSASHSGVPITHVLPKHTGRRSHPRRRQNSHSSKQSAAGGDVSLPHGGGVPMDISPPPRTVRLPMYSICFSRHFRLANTSSGGRTTGHTEEQSSVQRHKSKNSNTFSRLADLLCLPLLQHDRAVHQERLISLLARVMKEFVLTHSSPGSGQHHHHQRQSQQHPTTRSAVTERESTSAPVSVLGNTGLPADHQGSGDQSTSGDLMAHQRPEVLQSLCRLVLGAKSTEAGRNMAAQLIADLAAVNKSNRENMLQYLAISAEQLTATVMDQLDKLIGEITARSRSQDEHEEHSAAGQSTQSSQTPSTSVSAGQVSYSTGSVSTNTIVSGQIAGLGEGRTSTGQQLPNFNNLQLFSTQAFLMPNSDQCRLRGILGLMLLLSSGSCSVNSSETISVSAGDPFSAVKGLLALWPRLSNAFDCLHSLSEPNVVLLVQPLLEAFCLIHLHLVRDVVMLRHRSAIPGARSANRASLISGSLSGNLNASFSDMVPVLQLRTTPSQSVSTATVAGGTEPGADLHLASFCPLSPPAPPGYDEANVGGDATETSSRVSVASTSNALLHFAEHHRATLNMMLRNQSGSLNDSPMTIFLAFPRVLDFDIKRRIFRQQLQQLSHRSNLGMRYDDEPIIISRDRIFEDSYARLHRKSASEWKHKFIIRFQNEEGQDAGGPLREWFLLMSREIFNANYCLFRISPADQVTYTINPSSYINSNHLSYFKFVGRFVAKAIFEGKLLECYFSRAFYKHILGVPVKCSDLESEDNEFYKGLEFLLNNTISHLGYELAFCTEISEFGKTETRDLIENGRNILVTEQNKREYVRLVCQERMTGAIRQQLDAFLTGFHDIIPKSMISVFNEQELELLINGLPNIDITDLKANTNYSKYQANSPQIEWFWLALESFDQEDRALFLQFVTGTSKVPLGGFANLEGMHGPTKFQINRASVSSTSYLPCAHTCFNTLVLPTYETYEQLRARLLTAIRECSEGYGMA